MTETATADVYIHTHHTHCPAQTCPVALAAAPSTGSASEDAAPCGRGRFLSDRQPCLAAAGSSSISTDCLLEFRDDDDDRKEEDEEVEAVDRGLLGGSASQRAAEGGLLPLLPGPPVDCTGIKRIFLLLLLLLLLFMY